MCPGRSRAREMCGGLRFRASPKNIFFHKGMEKEVCMACNLLALTRDIAGGSFALIGDCRSAEADAGWWIHR